MDYIGFGYALTVATGGVIGYVKAGSAMSLLMGLLFGGLSAFGAYQTSQDPANFWILLGSSGFLGGMMGYRAFMSGKFMPAGLVASLSILMVIRLLPRLLK